MSLTSVFCPADVHIWGRAARAEATGKGGEEMSACAGYCHRSGTYLVLQNNEPCLY